MWPTRDQIISVDLHWRSNSFCVSLLSGSAQQWKTFSRWHHFLPYLNQVPTEKFEKGSSQISYSQFRIILAYFLFRMDIFKSCNYVANKT